MKILRALALLLLLQTPALAHAACADHFAEQRAPVASAPVTILCSTSFAVGYSGQDKEPLWSAEHLTEEDITDALALQGRSVFHEDTRIPVPERSELYDYKRSGWSRGHLAFDRSTTHPPPSAESQYVIRT